MAEFGDAAPVPVRVTYSRLYFCEEVRRAVCVVSDEARATGCTIEFAGHYARLKFSREAGSEWPRDMRQTLDMLQEAFERGRCRQKHVIAETLKKVIGL